MQNTFKITAFLWLALSGSTQLFAEVGDPTLKTDHEIYPGEGAFQTAEACATFATEGEKTQQEKAIALYLWLLTHQYHAASPQEWLVPGEQPNSAGGHQECIVYDAAKSRFSYGYGLCGTVHAWNEPYWQAAGFASRRRAFPGHTNSEIYYGDSWHAFDTDMAGILFRKDGVVAGYDDLIADPSLADNVQAPLPHYPFAWPGDFNGMKKGWQQVAKEKKWYALYNGGYEAQPGMVHLRSGETFTRWFDPDHYGGKEKRRYWHNQPGGPFRNWTYVNAGVPKHEGDKANARGNASYCNGEFVYQPDLTSEKFREGVFTQTGNVKADLAKGLVSSDGGAASIVFSHWSPYVICGDPVDDTNPMTGKATDGLVISGDISGEVSVEISADQGQTWSDKQPAKLPLDFTEQVKGHYGWRIRFSWKGTADAVSLKSLTFTTITQVNQTIYPRLTSDGCEVAYQATDRGVVSVEPNWSLPEAEIRKLEVALLRSDNLSYQPRSAKQFLAYTTTNNKPAHVVFPLAAPSGAGKLLEVRAAMRYKLRNPPPTEYDYRLQYSTDEGKTWQTFATADIPADNEYSSGWLAGKADVAEADAKSVLIRAVMWAGGYQTGLIDLEVYGVYELSKSKGNLEDNQVTVTYGWKEGRETKSHSQEVTGSAKWTVPTGNDVVDEFVRISHE